MWKAVSAMTFPLQVSGDLAIQLHKVWIWGLWHQLQVQWLADALVSVPWLCAPLTSAWNCDPLVAINVLGVDDLFWSLVGKLQAVLYGQNLNRTCGNQAVQLLLA